MSPEIIERQQHLGSHADVWALGVVLYVMLTGKLPFRSPYNRELYRKIEKIEYFMPTGLPE